MKVRVKAKTSFEDQGTIFSDKTFLYGEQDGDTIVFEKGTASGNRHEIPASSFDVEIVKKEITQEDRDAEIRRFKKVWVTPISDFTDQGIGFSSKEQYEGYLNEDKKTVEFLKGKLSGTTAHSIPYEKFQENLEGLYSPPAKTGKS